MTTGIEYGDSESLNSEGNVGTRGDSAVVVTRFRNSVVRWLLEGATEAGYVGNVSSLNVPDEETTTAYSLVLTRCGRGLPFSSKLAVAVLNVASHKPEVR